MASTLSSTFRARRAPIFSAVFVGIAGVAYFATRKPFLCESLPNAQMSGQDVTKTLSFPYNMLFPKHLTVSKVEQVNHDTKKITLTLPGKENEVSGVPGGGALLTQHTPSGRFFPVIRPYSPIVNERGYIQLLVKHYPNGAASTYMHSLQPGQDLVVRGPIPSYSWTPSTTERDVLFVAGGAGITPIYSLTTSILNNPDDKSRIELVWGVNGVRDIVLKNELESLEKQYPDRLRVTYCISGPENTGLSDNRYKSGYVNQVVLKEAISRFKTGSWGDAKGKKIFLCGPPAMEDAIAGRRGILGDLGVDKGSVHKF